MNTGYGSTLTIVNKISDDILEKKSISDYGKKRISNEIYFYKQINNLKINFSIPKILSISENRFTMEYLKDYITYQKYLELGGKIDKDKIFSDFKLLHQHEKKVSKEYFIKNLKKETYLKVKERYKEISELVEKYSFIKKVNGVEILSFNKILNLIENYIENYLKSIENFTYYPLHGDPQLNNILINQKTKEIKYIDPKGNFGDSQFYGMKEYDYAKFFFGLGGYSYFDLKEVDELKITNDNLDINIKSFEKYNFKKINLINIFIVSIWLGNAHCFKSNEYKAIESFFYSLYISTLLFRI